MANCVAVSDLGQLYATLGRLFAFMATELPGARSSSPVPDRPSNSEGPARGGVGNTAGPTKPWPAGPMILGLASPLSYFLC